MGPEEMRMMELWLEGYGCAQILALLDLEADGKQNPDLVRAVSGLQGGLGFAGKVCGALSGGACVLARHGGRGAEGEHEDTHLGAMIRNLVAWFDAEIGARHGGIDCSVILENDPNNRLSRCPAIVSEVHAKVRELLASRQA